MSSHNSRSLVKTITRSSVILPVILVFSSLASCSAESDRTHTFTVSRDGGVTYIQNSAVPLYSEELFTYNLNTELVEDDRAESILTRPSLPFLDERGFFFVPDASRTSPRIAVFNPDGRYEFDIGRYGDGPGEFHSPAIMSVAEGIVQVFDRQHRRLTLFQTNGEVREMHTLPPDVTSTWWRYWYLQQNGNSLLIESASPRHDRSTRRELRTISARIFSASWDSLASVQTIPFLGASDVTVRENRTEMTGPGLVPFLAYPGMVFNQALGIISSRGLEPEIHIHGLDGILQKTIQIDFPRTPVTPADRAAYEQWYTELTSGNTGLALAFAQQQLKDAEYPEFMSYWGDPGTYPGWLHVDEWGYIWIRIPLHFHPSDLSYEKSRFYVIDPQGEYLGQTTLPDHRRGRCRIDRGQLITMQQDPETGIERIRAYHIRSALRGFTYPELP